MEQLTKNFFTENTWNDKKFQFYIIKSSFNSFKNPSKGTFVVVRWLGSLCIMICSLWPSLPKMHLQVIKNMYKYDTCCSVYYNMKMEKFCEEIANNKSIKE